MNTRTTLLKLASSLAAAALLLAACAPATATSIPTPTASADIPSQATATSAPALPTAEAATPTPASVDGSPHVVLTTGSLAASYQAETVPALTDSANSPYWEILPQYTRVTLQGYPLSDSDLKPQIFIYPLKDLGTVNEGAGAIVGALQNLLKSPQEITPMPFLPLNNASQVMHVHFQALDFQNGKGVRYLTEFAQGIMPLNNASLLYTYQGVTSDGKYYVAAVLPVHHPSLPANASVTGQEPPEFTSDFRAYIANVTTALNAQPDATFTPDLAQLDALMRSLEVQ